MSVAASAYSVSKEVRTVIDDMPRVRDDAFVVSGESMVSGPGAAERVALQLPEAKRALQVVGSKCRERAAKRVSCASASKSEEMIHALSTPSSLCSTQ